MSRTTSNRRGRRGKDEGPRASFRQLLPFLLEHERTLAWVVILSIFGAAASLVQPLLVGEVITRVQEELPLGMLVWAIIGFVILASVISGYQHYLLQRTGTAVVRSSRRKLVARILRLPVSEFDARRTGDLVSRVGSDTTLLYAVLTQGLADAVGGALLFLGAIIAMSIIDPILLGLILLVLAVSVITVVLLSRRIRTASTQQQERVGELASGVERAVSSIRTIRASGATERETLSLNRKADAAYDVGVRIAKISALVVPVAGIALQVSLLVVLGVGGFRVASGTITIASLVTFIMFLFLLIGPLATSFGAITSVNQALGALGRIQEVLDLPTESQDDHPDPDAVATAVPGAPAISFRDVVFRYPEHVVAARQKARSEATELMDDAHLATGAFATVDASDSDVLRGISFEVPRGARVALVGPSGAGKSTILALIERFYDPHGGSIRINGHDSRTYPREELRSLFGYVEQDAPILAGTLGDNVRLASPHASDAECERVLRSVNLDDVLDRSPLGLDAPVGEDGVMLSGGERQRLAIARALLTDAPILLLDESTSSLDGANEYRMREAINAVAKERTMVVIAHRLSTVIDSDAIVVLNEGEVVGTGTHEELLGETPLYRELAQFQLLA